MVKTVAAASAALRFADRRREERCDANRHPFFRPCRASGDGADHTPASASGMSAANGAASISRQRPASSNSTSTKSQKNAPPQREKRKMKASPALNAARSVGEAVIA